MKRLSWAAAAISLFVAPVACLELAVAAEVGRAQERALREIPPRLEKDREFIEKIAALSVFSALSNDDAGPTLNARLRWDDLPGDTTLVSRSCAAKLIAAGASWRAIDPLALSECDTSIAHDLRRFGTWNMLAGPRAALPEGRRTAFAIPDYAAIQQLAKLHLLKAQGADREGAAEDVRHLARLLITTEYMVSIMVALAVLQIEQTYWEEAGQAWSRPPLDQEELARLRAHLPTAVAATNPLAPESARTEVLRVPGVRRCMHRTELAFGGRWIDVSTPECSLDSARWELAHPFVSQPRLTEFESLSVVARLGARMEETIVPARAARLARDLSAALAIPDDGWE